MTITHADNDLSRKIQALVVDLNSLMKQAYLQGLRVEAEVEYQGGFQERYNHSTILSIGVFREIGGDGQA